MKDSTLRMSTSCMEVAMRIGTDGAKAVPTLGVIIDTGEGYITIEGENEETV